jgi:hypothetical protein
MLVGFCWLEVEDVEWSGQLAVLKSASESVLAGEGGSISNSPAAANQCTRATAQNTANGFFTTMYNLLFLSSIAFHLALFPKGTLVRLRDTPQHIP